MSGADDRTGKTSDRSDGGASPNEERGDEPNGERSVIDRAMPGDGERDAAFIAAADAETAELRAAAIAAGRRKGGLAGAAMAGAMFAVAEIYEGPRRDPSSVVIDASSDPEDLDKDGLDVTVGDVSISAPALERLEPISERGRRKPPVV